MSNPSTSNGGYNSLPSSTWGGTGLSVGGFDPNANMRYAGENMPGASFGLQRQAAGYYGAPMMSPNGTQDFGRWNWMKPQQGGASMPQQPQQPYYPPTQGQPQQPTQPQGNPYQAPPAQQPHLTSPPITAGGAAHQPNPSNFDFLRQVQDFQRMQNATMGQGPGAGAPTQQAVGWDGIPNHPGDPWISGGSRR